MHRPNSGLCFREAGARWVREGDNAREQKVVCLRIPVADVAIW